MEKKMGVKSRAAKKGSGEVGKKQVKTGEMPGAPLMKKKAKTVRLKSRGDRAAATGTIPIPERPTPRR